MANSRRRDDSLSGQRLFSAFVRACDQQTTVKRVADKLNEELDQVTAPGAVQVANLDEKDPMVATVEIAIARTKTGEPPPPVPNGVQSSPGSSRS